MEEIISREEALAQVMNVDCYLVPEEMELDHYKKVPITEIASIGAGMSSLPTVFRTATVQMTSNPGNLYELTNDITLHAAKEGHGLLRGFEMGSKGVKEQGLFKHAGEFKSTVTTTMPINPATMCMAVAIIGLDKKMDRILEVERTLLDHIVAKERATLRNNIEFLSQTIKDYKYNWNNDRFLDGNYTLALEIRKEAGTYIKKYRELIEKGLAIKGLVKGDAEIRKAIKNISENMREYQIAVYVYAFASFIETMLNGNFDSEYLKEVSNRIEENSIQYRELYTKVYNQLLDKADATVESQIVDVLSSVGNAVGTLAAKSTALDLLDLDDALKTGSEKLEMINDKKKANALRRLEDKQAVYIRPFLDNISLVDKIYNEPVKILFDDNYIYFPEVG